MAKKDEKKVEVKDEVKDEVVNAKDEKPKKKSVKQLADEVERGEHGSGRERMLVLGEQYEDVQQEVHKRFIKRGRK